MESERAPDPVPIRADPVSIRPEPVSILYVLPNFKAGGAERVLMTLIRKLDRTRFAGELAVFSAEGPFADMMPPEIPLTDLQTPRLRGALSALLRLIRRRKPALVFATHSYVALALLAARRFLPPGTKIVVREPNTPSKSLPDMAHGRLIHLGYRLLLRRADLVVCLNSPTEEEMQKIYRVARARLVRLPNPVAVQPLRAAAAPLFREAGAGLRLVAAGRLTYAKGFDRLLTSLAPLPDDTRLTLYGAGPEEENLKALAESLGLGAKVRFAGFERQLAPALAGADAVVLPSRWEGMPNIVLEALACGTPVISTPEAGGVIDLARELPETALKLVPSEAELPAALAAVKIEGHATLRPSLLPKDFEEDEVAEAYAQALSGV